MKYLGGLILVAYAAVAFLGIEPFTQSQRGKLSADARRAPGGVFFWPVGFRGGK
jgi:hypothetical protein